MAFYSTDFACLHTGCMQFKVPDVISSGVTPIPDPLLPVCVCEHMCRDICAIR